MDKNAKSAASVDNANAPIERRLSTAEFAKAAGITQRRVQALCDEGVLNYRRRSPLTMSHYLIPASEVGRYLQLRQRS
jgi:hypothetical protein